MKKIIYASTVLAVLSITLFTGCKKDKEAFPTKPQSNGSSSDFSYTAPYFPTVADADGIFISAQVYDEKTVIVSPFLNKYEYGMAKFTGTTGNFASLIDIGASTFTLNDSTLVKAGDLSYMSSINTYSLNLGNKVTWKITSSSIPSFTYSLNGVSPSYSNIITSWDNKWTPIYPRILYPVPQRPSQPLTAQDSVIYPGLTYTAALVAFKADSTTHYTDLAYNAKTQYSIPISQYVLNADTVVITMIDASGFTYSRKVAATDSVAYFAPNHFSGYPSYDLTTFNLQISPVSYRDTTVNSKNYYFLKMASYVKYYNATK